MSAQGASIAAGAIRGFQQGTKQVEDRQARQQRLTQESERHESAQRQASQNYTSSNEEHAEQMKLLQANVTKMESSARNTKLKEALSALDRGVVGPFKELIKDPIAKKSLGFSDIYMVNGKPVVTKKNPDGITDYQSPFLDKDIQGLKKISGLQTIEDEYSKVQADLDYKQSQSNLNDARATAAELASESPRRRDALKQAEDSFFKGNPDATDEETVAFYNDYNQKITEGVGSVRETKDIATLNDSINEAREFAKGEYDEAKATLLETNIFAKLETGQQKALDEKRKTMSGNFLMNSSINRILKEAETGPIKIDKDLVANVDTYIDKVFGNDVPQSLKNVDFNTQAGLMLANFIKDISGATVSDKERDNLTSILMGGDIADELYVKAAMKSFARSLRESNKLLGKDIQDKAPSTDHKYTTFEDSKADRPPLSSFNIGAQ